jgi:hypothetical protein
MEKVPHSWPTHARELTFAIKVADLVALIAVSRKNFTIQKRDYPRISGRTNRHF